MWEGNLEFGLENSRTFWNSETLKMHNDELANRQERMKLQRALTVIETAKYKSRMSAIFHGIMSYEGIGADKSEAVEEESLRQAYREGLNFARPTSRISNVK
jgi:hypothetical protein